ESEWVLLLNPDVTVEPGFLDAVFQLAQEYVQTDPQVGVIGLGLEHADGSRQASSGPFPEFAETITSLVRPRSRRRCRLTTTDQPTRVPWVTGGCMLIRRECLERLGGLDEEFFLYYEDVDFCHRATQAGWTVWYDPRIVARHLSPLHVRRVSPALRLITRHALLTYAKRYWRGWQFEALARIVQLEAWWNQQFSSHTDRTLHALMPRVIESVRQPADHPIRNWLPQLIRALEASSTECDAPTDDNS
ncbi:MAG: glycosyltransferase, partial [Gemmataceae bacterium]